MSVSDYRLFLYSYGLKASNHVYYFVRAITSPNLSLTCLKWLWTLMLWKKQMETFCHNNVILHAVKCILGGKTIQNNLIIFRLTRMLIHLATKLHYQLPYKYMYRYMDELMTTHRATFGYILIMCFPITIGLPNMTFPDNPILFEQLIRQPKEKTYIDKYVRTIKKYITLH